MAGPIGFTCASILKNIIRGLAIATAVCTVVFQDHILPSWEDYNYLKALMAGCIILFGVQTILIPFALLNIPCVTRLFEIILGGIASGLCLAAAIGARVKCSQGSDAMCELANIYRVCPITGIVSGALGIVVWILSCIGC